MNTQNFNLSKTDIQLLSEADLKNTDGGWLGIAIAVVGGVVGVASYVSSRDDKNRENARHNADIDISCYNKTKDMSCFRQPVRPRR